MELIELTKELFDTHEVRILGTTDEPLFVARDIGVILGLTQIRKTINDFDPSEKGINTVNTSGGDQKMMTLTYKGLQKLLRITRKNVPSALLNKFGINEIRVTPKETAFITNIRLAFSDIEIIEQHSVCGYLIDIYFPKYNLAVEYDEQHHIRQTRQDIEREALIIKQINCTFLRIPFDENIFTSIDRIRRQLNTLKPSFEAAASPLPSSK
jgi:very-short-patch-repair endonuclease